MTTPKTKPRVTSFAPQFLVDDLDRSIRHRRPNEHLDAAAGVDGIEAFYAQCAANGVTILKPLAPTPWGTKDFYIEDPDGYVVSFGGRPTVD